MTGSPSYETALQIDPADPLALYELGMALAPQR